MSGYLRDYQLVAMNNAWECLHTAANRHRCLISQPTGTGKTETFLALAEKWIEERTRSGDGDHVLVLAHRQELVYQPAARWERKTGYPATIVMSGQSRRSEMWSSKLICGSCQTLQNPKRLAREFPDPKKIGLVIVDEAHHAITGSIWYQTVLDYFPHAAVMGLTATPDRADGLSLRTQFERIAFEMSLPDAIHLGWLTPIRQTQVRVEGLNYDALKISGKDFTDKSIREMIASEEHLMQMLAGFKQLNIQSPTIVFIPGVNNVARATEILNRWNEGNAHGVVGSEQGIDPDLLHQYMHYDHDRRKQVLKKFDAGDFQFLVNCGVFTEGFDSPRLQTCLWARPTKSRALFAQAAVGRITRVLPNVIEGKNEDGSFWRLETPEERRAAIAASAKPYCMLVDFVGSSTKHDLVGLVDLFAGDDPEEVVAEAKELVEAGESDAEEALEEARRRQAERDQQAKEREEARRKRQERAERLRKERASQLGVATTKVTVIEDVMLGMRLTVQPIKRSSWGIPEGDVVLLKRAGLTNEQLSRMTLSSLKQAVSKVKDTARSGGATDKQLAKLRQVGIVIEGLTKRTAGALMGELAANNWRPLPKHVVERVVNATMGGPPGAGGERVAPPREHGVNGGVPIERVTQREMAFE